MKSKFSQTMQDFSRAVIVPVKFMAAMGLFFVGFFFFQLIFNSMFAPTVFVLMVKLVGGKGNKFVPMD